MDKQQEQPATMSSNSGFTDEEIESFKKEAFKSQII